MDKSAAAVAAAAAAAGSPKPPPPVPPASSEPPSSFASHLVDVVWLRATAGVNDGSLPLEEVLAANRIQHCVLEKTALIPNLRSWCRQKDYVEFPTPLCTKFGLHLKLYAARPTSNSSSRGSGPSRRPNVLATAFTTDPDTGQAPVVISGKAVVLRTAATAAAAAPDAFVHLRAAEVWRAAAFLDDIVDTYRYDTYNEDDCWDTIFDCWRTCYPYYQAGVDTMGPFGFASENGRHMDGVTGHMYLHNQATVFESATSFAVETLSTGIVPATPTTATTTTAAVAPVGSPVATYGGESGASDEVKQSASMEAASEEPAEATSESDAV